MEWVFEKTQQHWRDTSGFVPIMLTGNYLQIGLGMLRGDNSPSILFGPGGDGGELGVKAYSVLRWWQSIDISTSGSSQTWTKDNQLPHSV